MNKPKFNIGDEVFVVHSSCHYGTKVPCTMCFGKLKVTVILGNGEHVDTECGHCQVGVERPSGVSQTWGPHAWIDHGPITGVTKEYDGWKYDVAGGRVSEYEIFTSRDEAEPVRAAKLAEEMDRKQTYERDRFVTATKKQVWSAGYHRNRIADHERHIEWHRMRLCMIDQKREGA